MCQILPARFKVKPFAHQVQDVAFLVQNSTFGLFNEMGLGKTKAVVDAACVLAEENKIDTVLVVSPAAVRSVWLDPDPALGEIRKHAWVGTQVLEYHARGLRLVWGDPSPSAARLTWIVTNYEYLRGTRNRERLVELLGDRCFMMVLDESSFIKSRRALQTRACLALGLLAARRVILSGTPITNNPLDLWSQLAFLSPEILPFKNFYHFRSHFAVMGGWQNKQVVRWVNLEQLQEMVAPYVVRREKKDCLDLPEKIYTTLEVPLSAENWDIYKRMRDEAVVWLGKNPSLAAQAGVRVMRLSQITSGFLGGVFEESGPGFDAGRVSTQAIGQEKLNCLRAWLIARLASGETLQVIVWCRFRAEIERAERELAPLLPVYKLYGGQAREERARAVAVFSRAGERSALLIAQPQAGGFGLNLIAANTVVYLSNDFNLATRLQSEDRVHRPGQTRSVLYVDVLATGTAGQKTIDHEVVKALRRKEDLARWTCDAWKVALEEVTDGKVDGS